MHFPKNMDIKMSDFEAKRKHFDEIFKYTWQYIF